MERVIRVREPPGRPEGVSSRARRARRLARACERLAGDASSSLTRSPARRLARAGAGVLINVAGWALCFVVGVALQRRLREPQRAS